MFYQFFVRTYNIKYAKFLFTYRPLVERDSITYIIKRAAGRRSKTKENQIARKITNGQSCAMDFFYC